MSRVKPRHIGLEWPNIWTGLVGAPLLSQSQLDEDRMFDLPALEPGRYALVIGYAMTEFEIVGKH